MVNQSEIGIQQERESGLDGNLEPDEIFSHAFVFSSFGLFSLLMIVRLWIAFYHGTSSMEFIHLFNSAVVNAYRADILILLLLVLHAIRVQLGVTYSLDDETLRQALADLYEETNDDALIERILACDRALRIGLFLCAALLPFILPVAPWWFVWTILFLNMLLFFAWWANNYRRIKLDEDTRHNLWIAIGDGFFGLIVVMALVFGCVMKFLPNTLLRSFLNQNLGLVVLVILVVHALILVVETFTSYRDSLSRGGRCFAMIMKRTRFPLDKENLNVE